MSTRDEVLQQVPGWDQDRVREARILVVGAGALGNEVLKNLALLNVRRIVIADFDRVEMSNLSRSVLFRAEDAHAHRPKAEVAAERLLDLNPNLEILSLNGDLMCDLGLGLLRNIDVAIACVDNRLARLYLNRWCFRVGIPWVNGGILNLSGQVSSYQMGHSCYECGLTKIGWKDIRERMGCTDMARRYAMSGQVPTTPISASIIAAIQVQEALKLFRGQKEQSLLGKMFSYEGQFNHSEVYETLPPKEECGSHFSYPSILKVPEISAKSTVKELFDVLQTKYQMEQPELLLDHPVATEIATMHSKQRFPMVIPSVHLSEKIAASVRQSAGEAVGIPKGKLKNRIQLGSELASQRLVDLGIPYWHILNVKFSKGRAWVELAGDADSLSFKPGHHKIPNSWFRNRDFIERH